MNLESIYHQLTALYADVPDLTAFDENWNLSRETIRWINRAVALVAAADPASTDGAKIEVAAENLVKTLRPDSNARAIVLLVDRAITKLEIKLPAQSQGSFVTAGDGFDAAAAISKILSTAEHEVMIIDPYLDEVVLTDFAVIIPEKVRVLLLTDQGSMKASLKPMADRWLQQYQSARPLTVKATAPRLLHDRLILVDQKTAWILTQSLKDFAKRSAASLQKTNDETANLKVSAYMDIWNQALVVAG